jgi:hypothetical protein
MFFVGFKGRAVAVLFYKIVLVTGTTKQKRKAGKINIFNGC